MSNVDVNEKAAETAAKKEAAEQAKAAKKAEREAKAAAQVEAKAAAKAEREAAKTAKKEANEKAKAEAKASKSSMPEQNGVRRPKPDSVTGKLWAIYDSVSEKNGSPATITESLEIARAQKIVDATTRTQYARWRTFNGISGRLVVAKAVA